jgi:hypothetical protein
MVKAGSNFMKIKIKTLNGDIEKIKDENEVDAIEVSEAEIQQVQQNPNTKKVAEILYTHASPGCIYVVVGGWARRVCS